MNLHLELSIWRICSENDSTLVRGFLAYFMWIQGVEEVGGGCRRALDTVGGLLDLEAALEDVWKSSLLHLFRICCHF